MEGEREGEREEGKERGGIEGERGMRERGKQGEMVREREREGEG